MGQLQEEKGYFFLEKIPPRLGLILLLLFFVITEQLFLEKKISSEKSWMIWNFFFLYLLRTYKNAFTTKY